jgi:hypothetical protein
MNWRTDNPPNHGYYLAAWRKFPDGKWLASELWYNPANGWWPSRGYLGQRSESPYPLEGVVAWMPLPEYPGEEAS